MCVLFCSCLWLIVGWSYGCQGERVGVDIELFLGIVAAGKKAEAKPSSKSVGNFGNCHLFFEERECEHPLSK